MNYISFPYQKRKENQKAVSKDEESLSKEGCYLKD